MATHYLKTWPDYYQEILDGRKRFEIRINDRGYAVGDLLCLQEYDPASKTHTGRELWRQVSFIVQNQFGLPDGVCVMSLNENLPSGWDA